MSIFGRPLEELITDLADGIGAASAASPDQSGRIVPVSVAFKLPVEAHVENRDGTLVVLADFPRTRTRTDFDRPLGRLSLNLVMGGPDGVH